MNGNKEYILELKNYVEYLKDIILELYDVLEDDIYISEDASKCYTKILEERRGGKCPINFT